MWAILSFVMLVRLGFGYSKLRGLKAEATPAPSEWQVRLRSLRGINGVRRQTQLLVSCRIAAPMSLGFLNPAILIPLALLDSLSDSELEHVVLHEVGHIRRWDDWTNLAQKLIEAMLPLQPAVYWIGHRMSIRARDGRAMTGSSQQLERPSRMQPHSQEWLNCRNGRRVGILAAGATGNRSQLFSRVHHMLDRTRNAAPKLAIGPLSAAIAAIGLLIYVGVRTPQMIAFAATTANEDSPKDLVTVRPPRPLQAPQAWIPVPAPVTPSALPAPMAALTSTAPAEPAAMAEAPESPLPPANPTSPSTPLSSSAPIAPPEAQQSGETHMEMTTTHNGFASLRVKVDRRHRVHR